MYCLLPIAYRLFPIDDCRLPIAYCLLPPALVTCRWNTLMSMGRHGKRLEMCGKSGPMRPFCTIADMAIGNVPGGI